MNILGINSVYHESAAALLVDGGLVAAVEEERFNRIKHGKEADFDNPHQSHERAIITVSASSGRQHVVLCRGQHAHARAKRWPSGGFVVSTRTHQNDLGS